MRVSLTAVAAALAGLRYETPGSFGLPATAGAADAVDGFLPEITVHGTSIV
jgi:hypothetical protein